MAIRNVCERKTKDLPRRLENRDLAQGLESLGFKRAGCLVPQDLGVHLGKQKVPACSGWKITPKTQGTSQVRNRNQSVRNVFTFP